MYKRWLPAIFSALMVSILAAIWIVFAPIQLGGQAAYIIITGNSMEPDFHTGDLVIARRQSVYTIGDIVAYHNAELKRIVFHRIIGQDFDRFVFKGDNNTWTDGYQPAQAELIGKSWIQVHSLGTGLEWIKRPGNISLIAGTLAGLLLITLLVKPRKVSKNSRPFRVWFTGFWKGLIENLIMKSEQDLTIKQTKNASSNLPIEVHKPGTATPFLSEGQWLAGKTGSLPNPQAIAGILEGLFFVFGLIAFGSLVLGIFAFSQSPLRTVPDDIPYHHVGVFSYSAAATPGIYDLDTIRSGEPIFPNLTCIMNVAFNYSLVGDQLARLAGAQQITARIVDEVSGWQRTILLKQPAAFTGGTTSTSASLNLCELGALTGSLEQGTNYFPSYYTLQIIPKITISGTTRGRELHDTYEPHLDFRFDKMQVYLIRGDLEVDPLNPSQDRLLGGTRIEASTIPILGMDLGVGGLRVASLLGLMISIVSLFFLMTAVMKVARNKESYIKMKYGQLLVDVDQNNNGHMKPAQVIDLATIEDLARLADRKNSMILHETLGSIHYYLVQGDGITYRFSLDNFADGLVNIPSAVAELELRQGFERGEFKVYYQPIVSLADGKVTAVEALLRWQHPQRGLVAAQEFIPTAESSGLIEPIGEWMLQVACSQLKEWEKAGVPLVLTVNFAESQLESDPVNAISRVLKNTGIDPHNLQLEIAEKGILKSAAGLIPKMNELKDLGLQLSIDNFDGRLPVSSIGQYPVTSVKIDRLLVQSMNVTENAANIREMVVSAQSAGMNVIAVGVETREQLEQVRSQYCAQVQGIFLGDPAPAGEITRLLLKGGTIIDAKPVKRKRISKVRAN